MSGWFFLFVFVVVASDDAHFDDGAPAFTRKLTLTPPPKKTKKNKKNYNRAYILGTIVLLVFKAEEQHGIYRDRMRALELYSRANRLPLELKSTIQDHLRLHYANADTDDHAMLRSLPGTLRRRLLRHQYGEVLQRCWLLQGAKPKFVDALLCAASVETFMPRVDLLQAGDSTNDLYIVVAGFVEAFAAGAERQPLRRRRR